MYLRVVVTIDHTWTVYHRVSAGSKTIEEISDSQAQFPTDATAVAWPARAAGAIARGSKLGFQYSADRSWAMGSKSKLSDMWQKHGPNAWTHAGKVWDGTRLNGEGGFYTEADFEVGVLSMQLIYCWSYRADMLCV